jgi:membrane protein DedA with SNARE-associated domain
MNKKRIFEKQPILFVLCWTLLTFVLGWVLENFIFDDKWNFISLRSLVTFVCLLIAGVFLYFYRVKKSKK